MTRKQKIVLAAGIFSSITLSNIFFSHIQLKRDIENAKTVDDIARAYVPIVPEYSSIHKRSNVNSIKKIIARPTLSLPIPFLRKNTFETLSKKCKEVLIREIREKTNVILKELEKNNQLSEEQKIEMNAINEEYVEKVINMIEEASTDSFIKTWKYGKTLEVVEKISNIDGDVNEEIEKISKSK